MARDSSAAAPELRQYRRRRTMNHTDLFTLAVPVNSTDHTIGEAHAAATVVEYGDFECPNCKQAASTVKLLLEKFAGRLRFVFRHFPLEEVHPHALLAAEVAEVGAAQGKFWPMHDLLFEHQLRLQPKDLHHYAQRAQLDMARYTAELDDHIYLQRVREHEQSGRLSGVRATPTFFVNGRIEDVSFGLQRLFDAVESRLAPRRP
jgi:protein-disulfide isomerase